MKILILIFSLLIFLEKPKPQFCDTQRGKYNKISKKDPKFKKSNITYRKAPPQSSLYKYVIYLEFYGDVITTPYWNGGRTITSDSALLSESEIDVIISQVQYDYKTFPVLITKNKAIYNLTSEANRQKMIITDTYSWYGSNAGGVAYLETLFWTLEVEGFVFSRLLNYDTKRVWETISHEVGHTIGLKHQVICNGGVITNQYNNTVINGNAPIMGSVPSTANGVWWVGPIPDGCKKTQKDSAFIKAATR